MQELRGALKQLNQKASGLVVSTTHLLALKDPELELFLPYTAMLFAGEAVATDKLAKINAAYDSIARQRGSG